MEEIKNSQENNDHIGVGAFELRMMVAKSQKLCKEFIRNSRALKNIASWIKDTNRNECITSLRANKILDNKESWLYSYNIEGEVG